MGEPLVIYECPKCGWHANSHGLCRNAFATEHTRFYPDRPAMVPVRVFREEDVRPLYEAARAWARSERSRAIVAAFPAPEEWHG